MILYVYIKSIHKVSLPPLNGERDYFAKIVNLQLKHLGWISNDILYDHNGYRIRFL